MESMNQHQDHQDSKSSNDDHEEGDRDRISDVNDEAAGTGRSYECVFCKRGFTTAQALGGHMNIHRKERAKTRPTSAPTNLMTSTTSIISKAGVDHHDHLGDLMRSYRSIQSYPPPYSTALAAPNASWIVRPPPPHANSHEKEEELCARNFVYLPRHQNLLRDDHRDWRSESGLSLGIGRPSRDDDRAVDDNKERVLVTEGDDELDLELRLGHDP